MARVALKFMVVRHGMTADEFLSLPPDDFKTQLIDGDLVETVDARQRHQDIVAYVLHQLMCWLDDHPSAGKAGIGGNWRLDERNVIIPDVWFRHRENVQTGDRVYLDGAQTLTTPLLPNFALDLAALFDR